MLHIAGPLRHGVHALLLLTFSALCCSAEEAIKSQAGSATRIVLQQDHDAQMAFVKLPPSHGRDWSPPSFIPGELHEAAYSTATMDADSVEISSGMDRSETGFLLPATELTTPTSSTPSAFLRNAAGPGAEMMRPAGMDLTDQTMTTTGAAPVISPSAPHSSTQLEITAAKLNSSNADTVIPEDVSHEQQNEEPEVRPKPRLFAVISAIGASCGWFGIIAVRCIGFLRELSPKMPLTTMSTSRPDAKLQPRLSDVASPPEAAAQHSQRRPRKGRMKSSLRLICPGRCKDPGCDDRDCAAPPQNFVERVAAAKVQLDGTKNSAAKEEQMCQI